MTTSLFLTLFTAGAAACGLLTEAIKMMFQEHAVKYSANTVALINAIVIGTCGTVCAYLMLGIPFNVVNILCIVFMTACIWLGSMIGYDKVRQLFAQLTGIEEK
jgi:hypothetical protein